MARPWPVPCPTVGSVGSLLRQTAVRLGVAVRSEPAGSWEGQPALWVADVTPPPREAGGIVTPRDALGLDSVYRAVSVLATACDQLTLDAWRGAAPLVPAPSLLRHPNMLDATSSLPAFVHETVTSLATRGEAFWDKTTGPVGTGVGNLAIIPPLDVFPYRNKAGQRRYIWQGKDCGPDRIQHLKLLHLTGEPRGLGPIQAGMRPLLGALDVARYGTEWFRTSGVPSGVLSTDQRLSFDEALEYKRAWHASVTGGTTAVLSAGLAYKPIYLTPREAQWLDSQRFTVTQVARLFGIPARLLLVGVDGSSMTYANAEQEDIQFRKYTLARYLREIETAFSACLPRGTECRFNVEGLLRTDTKTRYESYEIGLRAGFLTTDEVRASEGMTPLPEPAPAQETNPVAPA